MTLPVVDRATFLNVVRAAVERAAADVDWTRLLTAYAWNGAGWCAGVAARASMHRRLKTASSDRDRSAAVAEIVAWGGLPPLSADAVRRVLASLPLLDADVRSAGTPPENLYTKRIPAVSKIYAMYSPSRWIIYDSRVARALALIALELFGEGPVPTVMRFPQPPGRTGERTEGFPALGSERQARLAFVYASRFARELASRISVPCPDHNGWDARHIEMALFTLGRPAGAPARALRMHSIDAIRESIDRRLVALAAERAQLEAARRALVDQHE